ncbi:MAG: T9SS type A sorting domain-containing protein [Candidatus Latescibacterota bacterium]|nr:MAG: T9SS type A sorting domain-containing protein [Candidatus Latescibacterota bacterium]
MSQQQRRDMMRNPLRVFLCVLFALVSLSAAAWGKGAQDKFSNYKVFETPHGSLHQPDIGGSIDQAAAAVETTVLGWWQFEDLAGACDPQGWTSHDLTSQLTTYFHIDGPLGAGPGCNDITPINGQKSMWCGQWPTAEEPWCDWATLPGYGNGWFQSLVSDTLVCDTLTWSWTIEWDTEPGYDFVYAEYYRPMAQNWYLLDVDGAGYPLWYDGTGGPLFESFQIAIPDGWTMLRFRFASDEAWSDEDGDWPTNEGATKVDDITVSCNGGPTYFHDFEADDCGATQTADGFWKGVPIEFGDYANLHQGPDVIQEDPCARVLGCMWGFFTDPAVDNYACGGYPEQGIVPYWHDDLYINNEVRSPWVPIAGSGDHYRLQFLVYRDLDLMDLIFYRWYIRTRDGSGTPGAWESDGFVHYGAQKDWHREDFDIGPLIPSGAVDIQVALRVVDMCGVWFCEPQCRSHSPLFDQVRLVQVNVVGPHWAVDHIDLWQDNFPEEGGIGPSDYARCDMAQGPIDANADVVLPGDSLVVGVIDPNGLADDNTGGRPGKAVYAFVKVTDRFGNPVAGKNGLAIQSPDNQAYAADPNAGLLRWPFVPGLAPAGWDAYRMDQVCKTNGSIEQDMYCADLMDLGFGPTGPHYKHANENVPANTGIFAPGDVIHYFLAAQNTIGQWSYWHRTYHGQGAGRVTNDINEAVASPCEWSVLPDAGREPGDFGDILFVDDADGRGSRSQLNFDNAFKILGITDRVDRFDVLGSPGCSYNGLASRVKNIRNQIIGGPVEIYQKVLWNCNDLPRGEGLMGDGQCTSTRELSDDFALADTFLTNHPDNPGWAYWGDDVVYDWSNLGLSASQVKSVYMNHTLVTDDQYIVTGVISPVVYSNAAPPSPWHPETFYANGGCPVINDFDSPGATGASNVSHLYENNPSAPAAVYQTTPNGVGSVARFFLAGYGFGSISDDDLDGVPDYVTYLHSTLAWFENELGEPIGIDPLVLVNKLENAYPNPFNPTTTIKYSIAEGGSVTLRIYNAAGQLVRTLVDEVQSPQPEGFSKTWKGLNEQGQPVSSGVYFYKLTAKGFAQTKKMVLLK